ncbi:amino acid ABC transporter permease [Amycolatopsis sp. H20-H5]|uniref:amino acid ABC transporter permease n=1 Tax=Amycolatopsis sp. H20-H5 TaxID=3046309 RepID=UPI002DB88C4F|nr:amino acid ABC transporter permease [Amycolatopsis sp. H20-H5]MEC3979017.1 amino acid ABC transporter permease [Amycolatopsis sp. H20-H5]
MSVYTGHFGELGLGLLVTVELTGSAFVLSVVIAVVVSACRVAPVKPLRLFGTGFVEVFQNIPLLVWLAVFMFALPEIGLEFDLFPTATIAVALYTSAYYAEAIRSGINSIGPGQTEAARALGLGFRQLLRHVVLPQALRAMLQPIGTITIGLLMNTALVAGVGVLDLTEAAHRVILVEADPLPVFLGIGVVYGLLALTISALFSALNRKLAPPR